ncbi:hypothetical protein CYG49_02325 [Candidatus Saccharibacteria bacterium]|nr:MAG: hypothetical protein CYG49_02325 [Candidatus Saccharibacteria bacterium]
MLSTFAKIFGVVFVAVGLLGFVPMFTPNEHLLGLFHVNGIHNVIHLASGIVALGVGFSSNQASRLYFQIFGVVYALVAALGLIYGNQPILGVVTNNLADTLLHIAIAATALALGFGTPKEKAVTA